jgi:hypothetical protein
MSSEPPDADALIHSARHEVAGRQARGDYPPDLLRRLDSEFKLPDEDFASAPEALAFIPSARQLRADKPWGAAGVAVKRVVRRFLAWYVHPITVDQSRFNSAIVGELRKLERRVEDLESRRGRGSNPDSPERQ